MIGLGIQRAGFGAGFGFTVSWRTNSVGAFFLDNAQRAVAVRPKGSMVRGLKTAPSLLPAKGSVVMILSSTALRMTQVGVPPLPPRHIAKRSSIQH
jgi:hypothetical protein